MVIEVNFLNIFSAIKRWENWDWKVWIWFFFLFILGENPVSYRGGEGRWKWCSDAHVRRWECKACWKSLKAFFRDSESKKDVVIYKEALSEMKVYKFDIINGNWDWKYAEYFILWHNILDWVREEILFCSFNGEVSTVEYASQVMRVFTRCLPRNPVS